MFFSLPPTSRRHKEESGIWGVRADGGANITEDWVGGSVIQPYGSAPQIEINSEGKCSRVSIPTWRDFSPLDS